MRTRGPWSLHLVPGLLCLVFLLPLTFLAVEAFWTSRGALAEEAGPMVWDLAQTTILVAGIAMVVALLLGGCAAWAVHTWHFPGRRLISVLLCLPFAFPPYVLAGIYREAQHQNLLPIPPLENAIGAGLLLGLALYPWVYLPLKAQLAIQSSHYTDVARSLGLTPTQRFFRIHLGLLLPTLGMALLLVLMEVVSDFGTVSMLGVKTLSAGIHDAMFAMFRKDWAAQLSLLGLAIPLGALILFGLWHRRRQVFQPTNRGRVYEPKAAGPGTRVALLGGLGLMLLVAFFIPLGLLVYWAGSYLGHITLQNLPAQVLNTLQVALWVSAMTLIVALGLNLLLRLRPGLRRWRGAAFLINLNYAVPSVMLAIAVLFLSAELPDGFMNAILSESIGLLVFAGCLCFLCFPFFTIYSGLQALSPRLDDLCATLKMPAAEKTFRVYLPLLRRAVACGFLLVLVTMLKELPLTQVLQPFGFESLSLRLFTFAGMGLLEESAVYSLCLVALALYPVVALDRIVSGRAGASC